MNTDTDRFQRDGNATENGSSTPLSQEGEGIRKEAIAFLNSIRDYERENGQRICLDERTSEELYHIFKEESLSPHPSTTAKEEQGIDKEEEITRAITKHLKDGMDAIKKLDNTPTEGKEYSEIKCSEHPNYQALSCPYCLPFNKPGLTEGKEDNSKK